MGAFVTPPGQPLPMQDGEFADISVPNAVTFAFQNLLPPSALYVARDDVLVVAVTCSAAAAVETATVQARLLLANPPQGGQPDSKIAPPLQAGAYIQTIVQTFTVSPGGAGRALLPITLSEGYLLSLSVLCSGASTRGITFARAWINRGSVNTATFVPNAAYMLLAEYITVLQPASWPAGRFSMPTEGPGNIRTLQVSNPAAGADWSLTVPTNTRWRLLSAGATFATSAIVATRFTFLHIKDSGANRIWFGPPQASQTAGISRFYGISPSVVTSVISTSAGNLPLPSPCVLEGSQTISVNTVGIDVGDQWSALWFCVEEWLDFV